MYVYTMESVNLICSDRILDGAQAQPGVSTHLTIRELKLPNIEENFVDHVAGGAIAGIEIYSHINKLESTFTLAGWQPRVLEQLSRQDPQSMRYTAYGLIREHRSGAPCRAQAIIWGRLGQANPSAFRKGDMMEWAFAIKGITHYELYMQEVGEVDTNGNPISSLVAHQIYYWDFFENNLMVGGINLKRQENIFLGIPNVAPGAAVETYTS